MPKDKVFKKASRFNSLEDAKVGLSGSPEEVERLAKLRMDGQKIQDDWHKEQVKEI